MATPPVRDRVERPSEPSGNSAAGIVKAAVSPAAAVLTAWGKMPGVRTFLDYLARKIPVWAGMCAAGLWAGGKIGSIVAVGSLVGMSIDTGFAAWNQRTPRAGQGKAPAAHERALRSGESPPAEGEPEARREHGG